MEWASLFWKAGFGFMILSSIVSIGYLWATVENVRDVLRSTKSLISALVRNLMKGFVNKEIDALLKNIDGTLKRLNMGLPQLLENMNGIATSMQQIRSRLKPMNQNTSELTETVNQNTAKIDD